MSSFVKLSVLVLAALTIGTNQNCVNACGGGGRRGSRSCEYACYSFQLIICGTLYVVE